MKLTTRVLIAVCTVILTSSPLFAQALTRPEAERLIAKQPNFASTMEIHTGPEAFDRAVAAGVWTNGAQGWQPSAKAAPYFAGIRLVTVVLRRPLHRAVTRITGIIGGDESGAKMVEFLWHYSDLPKPIASYTGLTTGDHEGKASFRKYDDGWRVVAQELGSEVDGMNTRPFAADATKPLFRYLGIFADDDMRLELYRNGERELVGRLFDPFMPIDAPRCRVDGTYDAATGKITLHGVMKHVDPETGKRDDTAYEFIGISRPDRISVDVTKKIGANAYKSKVTLLRVREEPADRRWSEENVTSLEEWESHFDHK